MTAQEANKIIAEYMGYNSVFINVINGKSPILWIRSRERICREIIFNTLDTLIPVWEKLDATISTMVDNSLYLYANNERYFWKATSIQEAALIATAKAIKELNNER